MIIRNVSSVRKRATSPEIVILKRFAVIVTKKSTLSAGAGIISKAAVVGKTEQMESVASLQQKGALKTTS